MIGYYNNSFRSRLTQSLPAMVAMASDLIHDSPLEVGSRITISSSSQVPMGKQFADIIKRLALSSEIEHAEHRYGINFHRLSKSSKINPLDIIKVAAAIADSTEKTYHLVSKGISSDIGQEKKAAQKYIDTQSTRAQLLDDLKSIDLEKLMISAGSFSNLTSDIIRLRLDSRTMSMEQFHEVLAKRVSLGALEEGMYIPMPRLIDPVSRELSGYGGRFLIKKIIASKGLMAFALEPQDAPNFVKPTILFRPTTHSQANALETIADDLSTNIGQRSFLSAKKKLLSLLNDSGFLPEGEKAHLCGFSLGGAHAARLLATAPDKFQKAWFFNDPSTEAEVADEFATALASSSHTAEEPLEIDIYHTDKDLVTHAGEIHVGYIRNKIDETGEIREKCKVNFHKVVTHDSENDPKPTIIPKISRLITGKLTNDLRTKGRHHTTITLSNHLELKTSPPSTPRTYSSSGSSSVLCYSPRSMSPSDLLSSTSSSPRSVSSYDSMDGFRPSSPVPSEMSAASLSFRKIDYLSHEELDRMNLEEVQQFNKYRRSAWKIRGVLQTFCLIAQFIIHVKQALSTCIVFALRSLRVINSKTDYQFLDFESCAPSA